MRWRCLLLPAFFFVILLPPAPADEDSGMLDDEEELEDEAEDCALVLAAISAGMLSVAIIKAFVRWNECGLARSAKSLKAKSQKRQKQLIKLFGTGLTRSPTAGWGRSMFDNE